MLVSGTSVFHQGLQKERKKQLSFISCFWEIRNIDILLAEHYQHETEPFRAAAVTNTCTEVPDYTSLFSRRVSELPLLSLFRECVYVCTCVCVCVCETERQKKTEKSWVACMWMRPFLSLCVCPSVIHSHTQTNTRAERIATCHKLYAVACDSG